MPKRVSMIIFLCFLSVATCFSEPETYYIPKVFAGLKIGMTYEQFKKTKPSVKCIEFDHDHCDNPLYSGMLLETNWEKIVMDGILYFFEKGILIGMVRTTPVSGEFAARHAAGFVKACYLAWGTPTKINIVSPERAKKAVLKAVRANTEVDMGAQENSKEHLEVQLFWELKTVLLNASFTPSVIGAQHRDNKYEFQCGIRQLDDGIQMSENFGVIAPDELTPTERDDVLKDIERKDSATPAYLGDGAFSRVVPPTPIEVDPNPNDKENIPNFILHCDVPKYTQQLPVYLLRENPFTKSWVEEYAKKHFGITAAAKIIDKQYIMIDSPQFSIEVADFSLGIIHCNRDVVQNTDSDIGKIGSAPDQETCKQIAVTFLNEHTLMEEDAVFYRVSKPDVNDDIMSVSFVRKRNDVLIWGPGTKMTVDIGREGKVECVYKIWPPIEPKDNYPLISPEEALARLHAGKTDYAEGYGGVIDEMRLVYRSITIHQHYLEPYYLFKCHAQQDSTDQFEVYVSALQIPIMGTKPKEVKSVSRDEANKANILQE